MSIDRHPITPLETEIIEWARKNDTLSDHCDLIDYYTDTGAVPEHWRVKWSIMGVVKAFAQAKPEQAAQPLTDEETALDLLAEVFDAYENGTPCYEEPDEHGSFVGNAFVLSSETFHACADLLNRRRPVPAAPQPKD